LLRKICYLNTEHKEEDAVFIVGMGWTGHWGI